MPEAALAAVGGEVSGHNRRWVNKAMLEPIPDSELVVYRFNRLIQELLRGVIKRNCFRPWEIDLLLDVEACNLSNCNRRELLRRYQRAAVRQLENGAAEPMKFSDYLATRGSRRKKRAEPNGNGSAKPEPV